MTQQCRMEQGLTGHATVMSTDCEGDKRVLLPVQAVLQCDGSSSAAQRETQTGLIRAYVPQVEALLVHEWGH